MLGCIAAMHRVCRCSSSTGVLRAPALRRPRSASGRAGGWVPFPPLRASRGRCRVLTRRRTWPAGTSMLIEDVACPVEKLGDMTMDLIRMFEKHGYKDASCFGHALEGNLHLVFSQVRAAALTYLAAPHPILPFPTVLNSTLALEGSLIFLPRRGTRTMRSRSGGPAVCRLEPGAGGRSMMPHVCAARAHRRQ